jgi:hypothetical protein
MEHPWPEVSGSGALAWAWEFLAHHARFCHCDGLTPDPLPYKSIVMSRFLVSDWRAEQTRLTVFPTPEATTRSAEWWQRITEREPDETTTNPKKGSALVHGVIDPGRLILKMEAERIDWVLEPLEMDVDELALAREIRTLGPAIEIIDSFSALVAKWLTLSDLPDISRIAFGSVLKHPELDRRAGYLRLPEYVPVRVDPESSDFLYQINLPTAPSGTGIEGLRLNRLSKWSVSAWRPFSFRFSGGAVQAQPITESVALHLELDINTTHDFVGAIPKARLAEVYIELVDAARSIAQNGVAGR